MGYAGKKRRRELHANKYGAAVRESLEHDHGVGDRNVLEVLLARLERAGERRRRASA